MDHGFARQCGSVARAGFASGRVSGFARGLRAAANWPAWCLMSMALLLAGCPAKQADDPGSATGASGSGASTTETPPTDAAPPTPPPQAPEPDNADAVAALEAAGAELEKNGSGSVIRVDLRASGGGDDVLVHVAGLPQLEQLFVEGPNTTDAGRH